MNHEEIKKIRYKVGDLVFIRNDIENFKECPVTNYLWDNNLSWFKPGKLVTIEKINNSEDDRNCYYNTQWITNGAIDHKRTKEFHSKSGLISKSCFGYNIGDRVKCISGGCARSLKLYYDTYIAMNTYEEGIIIGLDHDETQVLLDNGKIVIRYEASHSRFLKVINKSDTKLEEGPEKLNKYPKGTYVVWLRDVHPKLGATIGAIDKINIEKDPTLSNCMYLEKFGTCSFKRFTVKDLKWFATREEAEAFSKRIIPKPNIKVNLSVASHFDSHDRHISHVGVDLSPSHYGGIISSNSSSSTSLVLPNLSSGEEKKQLDFDEEIVVKKKKNKKKNLIIINTKNN